MDFYVTANIPTSFGPLMGNLSTVLGVSSDGMALIQVDGSAVKIKPTFLEYYFTSVMLLSHLNNCKVHNPNQHKHY